MVPCLGPTIGQHRLMSTCVIVEGLPSERLFPLGERRSRMLSPERDGNTRDFGSRPSSSELAPSSEREASSSLGIAGHLGIRDFVQLLISRPSQRLRSPHTSSYKSPQRRQSFNNSERRERIALFMFPFKPRYPIAKPSFKDFANI